MYENSGLDMKCATPPVKQTAKWPNKLHGLTRMAGPTTVGTIIAKAIAEQEG
jgi:hypothetical protein